VVLASGQHSPFAIAVGTTDFYWLDATGAVLKCPIAGCPKDADGGASPITVALGPPPVFDGFMTVDSTNVYWTSGNAGVVMECPVTGCGNTPTFLASGQQATGIAVYADRLYWDDNGGGVEWCPISGCPTDGGVSYPMHFANTAGAGGLAVNVAGVFWVEASGPVERCPLTGCLTSSDGGPRGFQIAWSQAPDYVAVDSAKVYWVDEGLAGTGYIIYDCFLNGCGFASDGGFVQPELAAEPGQVQALTADSSGVYWLFFGTTYPSKDGTVMTCPSSGCPVGTDGGSAPTVLASGQSGPFAIALDSTSVYWVNAGTPDGGDGTVMRLAK
jgi:hypothetical protein